MQSYPTPSTIDRPDIAMQDSANPDYLYACFVDISERNNHLARQVDDLERRFTDLQESVGSVRTEFQGIKMGSTFSRSPREHTRASGLLNAMCSASQRVQANIIRNKTIQHLR